MQALSLLELMQFDILKIPVEDASEDLTEGALTRYFCIKAVLSSCLLLDMEYLFRISYVIIVF